MKKKKKDEKGHEQEDRTQVETMWAGQKDHKNGEKLA